MFNHMVKKSTKIESVELLFGRKTSCLRPGRAGFWMFSLSSWKVGSQH